MSTVLDAENWIAEEEFDFDVASSPTLFQKDSLLKEDTIDDDDDDDDEEVFFGPQTHTERCVAVVVKEKEVIGTTPEITPEEQALLLREAALLKFRIKHGGGSVSKNTKSSPIAIVRPMKREVESSKENKEEKEIPKITQTTNSRILQPKITNAKQRVSSLPVSRSKLPMSKNRNSTSSKTQEPIVDHASLYGLSSSNSTENKENKSIKITRRSEIPNRKKNEEKSRVSSTSSLPSMQSALPTTISKLENPSQNTTSTKEANVKPVKALPQSQLRLPSARRSLAPQGTPSNLVKPRQDRRSSVKREISKPFTGTPGLKNRPKVVPPVPTQFDEPAQLNLETPVFRTPSRKSIIGRQILSKSIAKSDNSDSCTKKESTKPFQTEESKIADDVIDTENQEVYSNTLSRSNIVNRYKKLCGNKSEKASESVSPDMDRTPNDQDVQIQHDADCKEPIVQNVNQDCKPFKLDDNEENTSGLTFSKGMEIVNINTNVALIQQENGNADKKTEETIPEPTEALVELLVPDFEKQLFLDVSPPRICSDVLDPFQTGETPPPLIDIGDFLQPEKPKEVLLIEF